MNNIFFKQMFIYLPLYNTVQESERAEVEVNAVRQPSEEKEINLILSTDMVSKFAANQLIHHSLLKFTSAKGVKDYFGHQ